MIFTALGGETLCEVAIRNGFPDCQKLRDANPKLKDAESLVAGTDVTIPDKKQNIFARAVDALHQYTRRNFPPPKVEFIKEGLGKGYAAKPAPDGDTKLEGNDLAVTNYVSDRGGDGLTAGNFPADTVYRDDPLGTADPDHFKIQVYDNGAKVDQVKVNLFALQPAYYKEVVDGVAYVRRHPTKYTRPDAATRKLENIVCKRIPSTSYFRSPYLRLVSTEASRAKRPTQCLLVGDYWDEGPKTYQKYYTEILHQRVEARYQLPNCPVAKCAALRNAGLKSNDSLHLAFHIVKGCGITPDDVRKTVYKWTRAALASTQLRPIIDKIDTVDIPKNMICVANLTQPRRGFHASGRKGGSATPSVMSFTVDGVQLFHSPTSGDSPETTADNIIAKITAEPALAGYSCRKQRHRRSDVTPVAAQVSDPFDILVFKSDGSLAVVTNVTSNDRPVGGQRGQSLSRVMNFTLDNFPVDWAPASPEQRILRWNYHTDGAMNMFIVGTPLHQMGGGPDLDGFSPYGPYAGWVADVGPIVYLSKTGVTRAFVILHEMCHPMMHNGHVTAPNNDAGTQTVELMDGAILTEDQSDATKHIADKPIKAMYELVEEAGAVLVDGTAATPAPNNTVTTPVLRLHTVAAFYGILKVDTDPVLDSGVADLPARPADA